MAVSICSSHGRFSSSAPPRVTNASAEATASTSPAGAPSSSSAVRVSFARNVSSVRASVHTAPVLTANPHAIGVNARSASKRVVGVVAAAGGEPVEAEAFERRSRDRSSAETTAPSQKHAAASISETTRQHAGKDADSGADVVAECVPSHASATVGTERRHSCRKYRGSLVATSATTRTKRVATDSHPAESCTRYVTRYTPGTLVSSSEASRSMRSVRSPSSGSNAVAPWSTQTVPTATSLRSGPEPKPSSEIEGHASGGAGEGSGGGEGASGAPGGGGEGASGALGGGGEGASGALGGGGEGASGAGGSGVGSGIGSGAAG